MDITIEIKLPNTNLDTFRTMGQKYLKEEAPSEQAPAQAFLDRLTENLSGRLAVLNDLHNQIEEEDLSPAAELVRKSHQLVSNDFVTLVSGR